MCRVVLESHEMRTVATQTAHLVQEEVVFCQLISAEGMHVGVGGWGYRV